MANKQSVSSTRERAPLSIGKGAAELREIVAFIDGRTETPGILEFAGILAQEHGARLISVFMQPEPTVTPAETFARGKGMQSVIEVHQAQLERIEADHRAQFEDIVRRQGIRSESEWRSLPYLSSEVAVHAYYADLVVVARPESPGQTAAPPRLATSLLLSSHRPLPPQRVGVRRRHADGPLRGEAPGPDVSMSVGSKPCNGPFDHLDVGQEKFRLHRSTNICCD